MLLAQDVCAMTQPDEAASNTAIEQKRILVILAGQFASSRSKQAVLLQKQDEERRIKPKAGGKEQKVLIMYKEEQWDSLAVKARFTF
jgi:hypothetical protein